MARKLVLAISRFVIPLSLIQFNAAAQELDMQALQKQIQVFTGVLQEGLELDTTPGFLGISSGRVTDVYLRNQGVLFEIRTPLANQRNRVSLNALASSIRGISGGTNPFEAMTRSPSASPVSERRVLSQASELAVQAAQNATETLNAIDYQATIEAAIREAYRRARMLRDIGGVEQDVAEDLGRELDSLDQQLQESLQQLRQLEDDAADTTAPTDDEADSQSLISEQQMQQLRRALQDLGDRSKQKAAELNELYEQAKAEYRQRWQQEIVAFEDSLFSLLCDYGATLRALPDDEHVSVKLIGLGADAELALPADRIHVVTKTDLQACQSGDLDWQSLRQRAVSYNY